VHRRGDGITIASPPRLSFDLAAALGPAHESLRAVRSVATHEALPGPVLSETFTGWTFVPQGRKLYVRLPEDADPTKTVFEVAQHPVLLDIENQKHIDVSGLAFTGGNSIELNKMAAEGDFARPANFTQMAAIRLRGNTANRLILRVGIDLCLIEAVVTNEERECHIALAA